MEGALGVIPPTPTHISHMQTLKASKGTALNPETRTKALRNPQRAQEAGATGFLGDKGPMGSAVRKASWRKGQGPNFE